MCIPVRYSGYVIAVDPHADAPDGSGIRVSVRVTDSSSRHNGKFIVNTLPQFSLERGMEVTFVLASFRSVRKAIDIELAT